MGRIENYRHSTCETIHANHTLCSHDGNIVAYLVVQISIYFHLISVTKFCSNADCWCHFSDSKQSCSSNSLIYMPHYLMEFLSIGVFDVKFGFDHVRMVQK